MILVIFTISLLNVSIGFALAIYLGFGPPGLMEAWDAMCSDTPQSCQEMGLVGLPMKVAEESRVELGMNFEAGPLPESDIDHAAADFISTRPSSIVESSRTGLAGFDEPDSGRQTPDAGTDATAMEAELLDELAEIQAMAEQLPPDMFEPSAVPVHAGE